MFRQNFNKFLQYTNLIRSSQVCILTLYTNANLLGFFGTVCPDLIQKYFSKILKLTLPDSGNTQQALRILRQRACHFLQRLIAKHNIRRNRPLTRKPRQIR